MSGFGTWRGSIPRTAPRFKTLTDMKKYYVIRYEGIDYVLDSARYPDEYPAHSFASDSAQECQDFVEENHYYENVRHMDFGRF